MLLIPENTFSERRPQSFFKIYFERFPKPIPFHGFKKKACQNRYLDVTEVFMRVRSGTNLIADERGNWTGSSEF